MHNLIRFYNQNRKAIWIGIGIIASLFILLQLLNFIAKKNNNKIKDSNYSNLVQEDKIQSDSKGNIATDKSVVTGDKLSSESLKDQTSVIEQFLNLCKKNNDEEAYNMITDECKEEMFNTVEDFKNIYLDSIFKTNGVTFKISNWFGNTYKVDFTVGDMLSTGNPDDVENIQDYITLKSENNETKVNINKYVGRYEVNREKEDNNIKISVISKDIYMDYEKYKIKVENNTDNDILLDERKNINTMYIQDEKDVKHAAYTQELTTPDLTVNNHGARTLTVKYYSAYTSSKKIDKLVFSDVVLNYSQDLDNVLNPQIGEISINL